MFAVSRFRAGDDFEEQGRAVVEFWRSKPGCQFAEVVRCLDDQGLWAIISQWDEVGSYRRSFNGYDAKMLLTPILGRALDEPSAFLAPEELGENRPRGEGAAGWLS